MMMNLIYHLRTIGSTRLDIHTTLYYTRVGLVNPIIKLRTFGQLFASLRSLRGNYVTNKNKGTLLVIRSDLEGLRLSSLTSISKGTQ